MWPKFIFLGVYGDEPAQRHEQMNMISGKITLPRIRVHHLLASAVLKYTEGLMYESLRRGMRCGTARNLRPRVNDS